MTRSLTSPKFNARISGSYVNTLTDGNTVSGAAPNVTYTKTLTNGAEENQANRAWMSEDRALANYGQETLDLYDMSGIDIGSGEGLDALGQAIIFEEIVCIMIVNENDIDAAGELEIIPASSKGWDSIGSHTVANDGALAGQGCLFKANPASGGFNIIPGSKYRITLKANGGDVTYSVYIFARSDDEQSSSSGSSTSSSSTSSNSSSSNSSSSSTSSMSSSSNSSSSSSSSLYSLLSSSSSSSSSSFSSTSPSSNSSSSISTSSTSQSSSSSSSTSSASSSSSSSSSESSSSVSV